MEIENKQKNEGIPFGSIRVGAVMERGGNFYLKVESLAISPGAKPINCVNLTRNTLLRIYDNEKFKVVLAKVVINTPA